MCHRLLHPRQWSVLDASKPGCRHFCHLRYTYLTCKILGPAGGVTPTTLLGAPRSAVPWGVLGQGLLASNSKHVKNIRPIQPALNLKPVLLSIFHIQYMYIYIST